MSALQFTPREKADAADREAKYRARVYPRWVEAGRIKPEFADRQLRLMREIAKEYRLLAEAEEARERLI